MKKLLSLGSKYDKTLLAIFFTLLNASLGEVVFAGQSKQILNRSMWNDYKYLVARENTRFPIQAMFLRPFP